jgi:hypothetical protein
MKQMAYPFLALILVGLASGSSAAQARITTPHFGQGINPSMPAPGTATELAIGHTLNGYLTPP